MVQGTVEEHEPEEVWVCRVGVLQAIGTLLVCTRYAVLPLVGRIFCEL